MQEKRRGGCLCGQIEYEAIGPCVMSSLCHCPSCRRATGAPVVAWAMYEAGQVSVTKGQPAVIESSAGVRRQFCRDCGTSLFTEADYLEGLIDVTIGSLDEPESLPPEMHIWDGRRLDWLETRDEWPRHEAFPPTD